MAQNVNAIRNPDYRNGKAGPTGWTWHATNRGARWQRVSSDEAARDVVMRVTSNRRQGTAVWTQTVSCKPNTYYRVEATVACELQADGDTAGFVLSVEPMDGDRPAGPRLEAPTLHRTDEPVIVRALYMAPKDVRRLKLSAGLADAEGTADIHEVRLIRIIEPDQQSHPMALPSPRHAMAAPRVCRRVCVCADGATERTVTTRLATYFGDNNVATLSPKELTTAGPDADALLLPDPNLPRSITSLSKLARLAEDRVVIVSTPAFSKLSPSALTLRRIEQDDDPIHAKVMFADTPTHGFALQDVFGYAWDGKRPHSYVQNQFRDNATFKTFCKRHGFEILLSSMCDKDATSDRPISLFKRTERGMLLVLDIEPVEAAPSTRGETNLAMHLLLSIFGHTQVEPGQYTVPHESETAFRVSMRDTSERFADFVVHDADVPSDEVTEQLVTIGRDDQSFGLPLRPKPVILVRSGLTGGDVESVYGAMYWFKQLIRMPPYRCPYGDELASKFRLAWIPCPAPWEFRDGWRRSNRRPTSDIAISFEDASIASMIDVVTRPINRVRVVMPGDDKRYHRGQEWLPSLWSTFGPHQYFAFDVPAGETFDDRTRYDWRLDPHEIEVSLDPGSFSERAHTDVIKSGGLVYRIEAPSSDADLIARSIHRTGLIATLLEQVIGLQYGLIAVNRGPAPAQLDGFAPVEAGQALIVDQQAPELRSARTCVG